MTQPVDDKPSLKGAWSRVVTATWPTLRFYTILISLEWLKLESSNFAWL